MAKIKVRRHSKKRLYVHNDLSNAAFYFKKRVESRLQNNDLYGIAFDHMAFLILSAFAFEARINFLGKKLVPDWKERSPFDAKVAKVLSIVGITRQPSERPFSTLRTIKNFRDTLAHGKPDEKTIVEEVIIEQHEADQQIGLTADWQKYCTPEVMETVYDDLDALWKMLLEKSGIEVFETLTSGFGGVTVIQKLEEDKT